MTAITNDFIFEMVKMPDNRIDLSEKYSEIARRRIEHAKNKDLHYDIFENTKVKHAL